MPTPPFTTFPIPTVPLGTAMISAFGFRTPAPTSPVTVFISPTGNDSNSGTSGSPFKTLSHASAILNITYDLLGTQGKIKCAAGTYNFPTTGDQGYSAGLNPVGGASAATIIIEGADPNDPTLTIFDDNGAGKTGVTLPAGSTTSVLLSGVSFKNFGTCLNNQSSAGTIFLGNTRFNICSSITFNATGGGSIISGENVLGSIPRVRIAGAHNQLVSIGRGSKIEFGTCILDFEVGCTFSFAIFGFGNGGGVINYHDNANQGVGANPTGKRFVINGGGIIGASTYPQDDGLNPSQMPGTIDGEIQAGWFNQIRGDNGRVATYQPVNVYVSPSGSDSTGDGTQGNPWRTVTQAWFVLAAKYDVGAGSQSKITINLTNGTYNTADGDTFAFMGSGCVGNGIGVNFNDATGDNGLIVIKGNQANPQNVVIDGGGFSNNAAFNLCAPNTKVFITGVKIHNFQNFATGGISCSGSGSGAYFGNVIFDSLATAINTGFNCIAVGVGPLTFSGTNGQLCYNDACSVIDLSVCNITFSGVPSYSNPILVCIAGVIYFNTGLTTGTATGQRFNVTKGGILWGMDINRDDVDPSTLPGNSPGIVTGGYYCEISESSWKYTVATLPTPVAGGAIRAMVTDSNSTVFNNTVAGGGANIVPVWWNGANWKIG